jgi:hypothetical protein
MPWISGSKEIADYCGISRGCLFNWMRSLKDFPVAKIGGSLKTKSELLDTYLNKMITKRELNCTGK